jgi:hypothetical protein
MFPYLIRPINGMAMNSLWNLKSHFIAVGFSQRNRGERENKALAKNTAQS